MTQAELASRTGTTQSAIARIESGASRPTFERLTGLVRGCGLHLQVRLLPHDDHDITLAQDLRRLDPSVRLERMLAVASLRGAAGTGKRPSGAG